MGRIRLVLTATSLLLTVLAATPAKADDVDVALVLVTDVSRSIDDSEFTLEKNGYASAFTSQKVLEAIQGGPTGKIAVAYVEFASSFEVRTVLDWTVIHDKASAQAFVEKLAAAPRSFWGRTAISAGIDQAMQLLDKFHNLLTTDVQATQDLGKLKVFCGVRDYPARVKCATLAWHTLKSALENKADTATTE